MDLDSLEQYNQLDTLGMLSHINGLPGQLFDAWEGGLKRPIAGLDRPNAVIIAGMGGSAIGADLLVEYISAFCPIPVCVHRDYGLPAWAGKNTLVILSSHSGNTEETLSAFRTARDRKCMVISICKGGELSRLASDAQLPLWTFQHDGQPRAAVGLSFGLLLALFQQLNLIPEQAAYMRHTVDVMVDQQQHLLPEVAARGNPAKRLAGQLVGRNVVVFGSGCLVPVARRWKGQVSELAKAWAQFEALPEADHNTLAGVFNPQEILTKTVALFLRGACDHPANRLRSDMTREIFMLQGIGTDFADAKGDHPLANMWSLLHFGDYVAYYLAIAYHVDPTPVEVMEELKRVLHAMQS